jgi:peptidoglycan/LPS O-acetylase OafA/YrhL
MTISSVNRRADIQGLRAIAVLSVILYHAGLPIPGGFVGVDIFFVISGFVITSMLQREWSAFGAINFKAFYWNRFRRLIPALSLVVISSAILSVMMLPPVGVLEAAIKTQLGAMLMSANQVIANSTGGYFDVPAKTNPLLNTWSLSVEEQFYVIFPAILYVGWIFKRFSKIYGIQFLLVAILTIFSFALAIGMLNFALPVNYSWLMGFYSPLNRAWEFSIGSLFALGMVNKKIINRQLSFLLSIAGIVAIISAFFIISDKTPFPSIWTVMPVLGALFLIAAGTNLDAPFTRLMAFGPLSKVGDLSYSLYLWHWPFIVFASRIWPDTQYISLYAAALSIFPAIASYYFVEQPIRSFESASRFKKLRLMFLILVPPLLLSGFLLAGVKNGFWIPSIQNYQSAAFSKHAGDAKGCFNSSTLSPDDCVWNASAKGAPIYLVGDSYADQFSDGVIDAGTSLDRPVFSFTKSTCPFFDIYLRNPLIPDPRNAEAVMLSCRSYYEKTLSWLEQRPSGTVIIGYTDQYWTFPGMLVGDHVRTELSADSLITSDRLIDGLHAAIKSIEKAGHKVIVLMPIPSYGYPYVWSMQTCTTWSILNEKCNLKMPLDFALKRLKSVYIATERAVIGTNARILDLSGTLCPSGVCGDHQKVTWTFDGLHISVVTSKYLAPDFADALER